LLLYLNEEEAYFVCKNLLSSCKARYLITSQAELENFAGDLASIIGPFEKFAAGDVAKVVMEMVCFTFLGYLRGTCVLRILMAFLSEGVEVVGKCAVVLVMEAKKRAWMNQTLRDTVKTVSLELFSADEVLKKASKIALKRQEQDESWRAQSSLSFEIED
jgi:hypothetical protein